MTERLHFHFSFHALEKEMAAHSSVLAWTGEPGGLQSMGSHRVGHDWSDLAAAAAQNHGISHMRYDLPFLLKYTEWRSWPRSGRWKTEESDVVSCTPSRLTQAVRLGSVTKSCLTLCNSRDCCPPGSSVHGILQARTLEWVAMSFSGGSAWPRDQTRIFCISCTSRRILHH